MIGLCSHCRKESQCLEGRSRRRTPAPQGVLTLPPWVRIPLPKDVGSSRQPFSGEHTKSGAILEGTWHHLVWQRPDVCQAQEGGGGNRSQGLWCRTPGAISVGGS